MSTMTKSIKIKNKKNIISKGFLITISAILVGFSLCFLVINIADTRSEKASIEIMNIEKDITQSRAFLNPERKLLSKAEKKRYANMIYIPAGEFIMGSNSGHTYEKPSYRVYLDSYYMDKYETTFRQYDGYAKEKRKREPSDSGFGRGNRPVINVTWDEAKAYCEYYGKRLPTEAEWEKASRAGSNTKYSFGDDKSKLGEYAWYGSNLFIEFIWHFFLNSGYKMHFVGTKKPNKWGLYDMHGNVWEWCNDWYDKNSYRVMAKQALAKNPKGPNSGVHRVLRGGSWLDNARSCNSANRFRKPPSFASDICGFRCATSAQ